MVIIKSEAIFLEVCKLIFSEKQHLFWLSNSLPPNLFWFSAPLTGLKGITIKES